MNSNSRRDSLGLRTKRKRQVVPLLGAAVGLCTVTVFTNVSVNGEGVGTVLLQTGWVFVVAFLAALAVYRFMLSHYDHRTKHSDIKGVNILHVWFMRREALVDHLAIPVTIGALVYTAVFGIFLVSQVSDAVIRSIVSVLTFL